MTNEFSPKRKIGLIRAAFGAPQEFIRIEATSGIVLFVCTCLALVWANSPWGSTYESVFQSSITVGVDRFALSKSLLHWINDGFMSIFFLVVGLEIKRELVLGELSSPRQAMLPIVAALGGMVVPALTYYLMNKGTDCIRGWGIPMATDIAFAIGVLALLGNRVPTGIKVFLLALAIVDDLGAVIVIAIFYSSEISFLALGASVALMILLLAINRIGYRRLLPYLVVGVLLWFAVLKSGVHATIAGVMLAMTIPAREGSRQSSKDNRDNPLRRLEHAVHPWVSYFILPIFALANGGIAMGHGMMSTIAHPVAVGIILGLVVGKQLGITLFSWLAVTFRIAELPRGVRWLHVYGAGWLGGIGFTMSLFIATLAFGESTLLSTAKLAVLVSSVVAGTIGWTVLRKTKILDPHSM